MPPLPPPGPLALLAWSLAVLAVLAALARRDRLGPGWVIGALLPALVGQIGTLLSIPRPWLADPDDPVTAASATLATAVAPEAHGYLAGGIAATALAVLAWRRADRSGAIGAVAGTVGVIGAGGVSLAVGSPSVWLGGLAAVSLLVGALAGTRRAATLGISALVAVVLVWLGARHFLLFAQHHAAIGEAELSVLAARGAALDAVMVAGPGMLVAVAAAALASFRATRPTRAGTAVALGLVALGGVGFVNTTALEPLGRTASGGRLPATAPLDRLPEVADAVAAQGGCVAWPTDEGWRVTSRFDDGDCDAADRLVVGAPADTRASAVVDRTWLDRSATLEVLARPPVGPRARGPLGALAWRAVPVRWVNAPLPSTFSLDGRLAEQLEGWLDDQLGIARSEAAVPGSVWMVDTPQGDMILLTGGGVTADDPDDRREILGRLLRTGDLPRLVLVLGEHWTVQHALDLCAEARAVGLGAVPCVWVRGER